MAGEGAQTGGVLEEKPRDREGVGKETPCVGFHGFSPSQAALVTRDSEGASGDRCGYLSGALAFSHVKWE